MPNHIGIQRFERGKEEHGGRYLHQLGDVATNDSSDANGLLGGEALHLEERREQPPHHGRHDWTGEGLRAGEFKKEETRTRWMGS
jgi:hypothetical protein